MGLTTIWILWTVINLVSPKADVVLPVDEFTSKDDCEVVMGSLARQLTTLAEEDTAGEYSNISHITVNCIPVEARP